MDTDIQYQIGRWLRGEEDAFREIFTCYYPPLYRYAFRYLKSEAWAEDLSMEVLAAIWEKKAAILGHETALFLVNELRSKRKAATLSSVDLNALLKERALELNWENWRRNDLIRYGKFEDAWGYKTDNDVNKRLFPIPSGERILNPGLVQNAGY